MTEKGFKELENLIGEYKSDVELTIFNLGEKTMLSATYKAKWIMQYATYKHELSEEEKQLNILKDNQQICIRNKLKIDVSDVEWTRMKLKNTKAIEKVEERIEDYIEILEVLSDLKKAIAYFNNDIRNAIDYQKLERI